MRSRLGLLVVVGVLWSCLPSARPAAAAWTAGNTYVVTTHTDTTSNSNSGRAFGVTGASATHYSNSGVGAAGVTSTSGALDQTYGRDYARNGAPGGYNANVSVTADSSATASGGMMGTGTSSVSSVATPDIGGGNATSGTSANSSGAPVTNDGPHAGYSPSQLLTDDTTITVRIASSTSASRTGFGSASSWAELMAVWSSPP